MKRAIELARHGLGRTAPNPPVGAVIVKDGRIIGEGFHPQAGLPHAEIHALQAATENPRGATLYVTLEPCCHTGRTPPCTEALIQAGLARVVIGAGDPHPMVSGNGAARLRQAGIAVEEGVCGQEVEELIRWYAHWTRHKRAYALVKAAITMDGRIAAFGGDSRWISSEVSRALVHARRNEVDAVLVGAGTVLRDDPQLTCRIPGGRDPIRVILDRDLLLSSKAKCLGPKCIVLTAQDPDSRPELSMGGTRIIPMKRNESGRISWREILELLGGLGFHAVMIEGGKGIYSSIIQAGLFDRFDLFMAPKLLGGGIPLLDLGALQNMDQALPLRINSARLMGGDLFIEAYPEG